MYQETLGINFDPSRPLWLSLRYSTGKHRSDRCFYGRNHGTALGGKQKIGAKLCFILLSFFLGYQLLLGTKLSSALDLESFGEVASQNKIEFHSGLWRALEGLLLGTKSRSAEVFVELLRGRFLEQNWVPLWNLESFGGVPSWNKIVFRSRLHRALERLLLQT
jgi:hypothetical protein